MYFSVGYMLKKDYLVNWVKLEGFFILVSD